MKNVEVIKANTTLVNRNFSKKIDRLRVAAYCRVSTDSEDQLNSYKSQVKHYTDYINQNHDWVFAGIYADEAITGTQTTKREDFQRMINDALNGEIGGNYKTITAIIAITTDNTNVLTDNVISI